MTIDASAPELVLRLQAAYRAAGVDVDQAPFPAFFNSVARNTSGATMTPRMLALRCVAAMRAAGFHASTHPTELYYGLTPAIRAVSPTPEFAEKAIKVINTQQLGGHVEGDPLQ